MENHYITLCSKCSTKNELFRLNCKDCSSILNNRVPNLDFWNTAGKLFISPIEAFSEIIRSEHKNFVILLSALFIIRIISFSEIFTSYLLKTNIPVIHSVFIIPILFAAIYIILPLVKKFSAEKGFEVRFSDISSCLLYAQIPLIISGTFLFLLEYIFFGNFLFMKSPNIFMINAEIAWLFITLEALCFGWMLLNSYLVFRLLMGKKLIPGILSIVLYVIVFSVYFGSLFLYGN